MDKENGARVEVNVDLNRGLLGFFHVVREASVHETECLSHRTEHEEFNNRVVDVEEHSSSEGDSDIAEPEVAEVWETTACGHHTQGKTLLSQVGVNNQKQQSSVEELDDEDSICDKAGLLGFSVHTDVGDKFYNKDSQNQVDANNEELDILVRHQNIHLIRVIHVAKSLVNFYFSESFRVGAVNFAERLIETTQNRSNVGLTDLTKVF